MFGIGYGILTPYQTGCYDMCDVYIHGDGHLFLRGVVSAGRDAWFNINARFVHSDRLVSYQLKAEGIPVKDSAWELSIGEMYLITYLRPLSVF
jgi:hypothetical protein